MIIFNPQTKDFYRIPDEFRFDPTADASTLVQDAAALQLAIENATAAITAQVNQTTADQAAVLDAKISRIEEAIGMNSDLAATLQPQIDALKASYASLVSLLPSLQTQ